MYLYAIRNLSKIYQLNEGKVKYALKNISFTLPDKGMIILSGKSGCGKTTLLNIISGIDSPSEGEIYFKNKKLRELKGFEIDEYHNKNIGFVFQQYNLIQEESVLFNLKVPLLINGYQDEIANEMAINLLKDYEYPEILYNEKCQNLSGGEAQRVSIMRAVINNPNCICADEPTGALDEKNAVMVMEELKMISKSRLVIVASHNQKLNEIYGDTIIYMKDGSIKKVVEQRPTEIEINVASNKIKHKKKNKWYRTIAKLNLKKHWQKHISSLIALTTSLLFTYLIIGFCNNSLNVIQKETQKQFDYGTLTFGKELKNQSTGSGLTIVQTLRCSEEEIYKRSLIKNNFLITLNYDALVPKTSIITTSDNQQIEATYNPIYSFEKNQINSELLIDGHLPKEDTLLEVLANKKTKLLLEKMKVNIFDDTFFVNFKYKYEYFDENSIIPLFTDYFIYSKEIKIVGIIDELDFLSTPKIFYSYSALENYLSEYRVDNYSFYFDQETTWNDLVRNAEDNDTLSSYSHRLFLKSLSSINEISNYQSSLAYPYVLNSNSQDVSDALIDFVLIAKYGLLIFLILIIIGTCLIIGISIYSTFTNEHKNNAILRSFGANSIDLFKIYLFENGVITIFAILLSILIIYPLQMCANHVIKAITSFNNLINVPFLKFGGVYFLFPLLILTITFLIVVICTSIPIIKNKNAPIKEELSNYD